MTMGESAARNSPEYKYLYFAYLLLRVFDCGFQLLIVRLNRPFLGILIRLDLRTGIVISNLQRIAFRSGNRQSGPATVNVARVMRMSSESSCLPASLSCSSLPTHLTSDSMRDSAAKFPMPAVYASCAAFSARSRSMRASSLSSAALVSSTELRLAASCKSMVVDHIKEHEHVPYRARSMSRIAYTVGSNGRRTSASNRSFSAESRSDFAPSSALLALDSSPSISS